MYYFVNWVEHPLGGNAGAGWIDRYLHAAVSVGGPFLGLPKAAT